MYIRKRLRSIGSEIYTVDLISSLVQRSREGRPTNGDIRTESSIWRRRKIRSMLEEKGRWVAGEDPKRDEEMAEAVIEVLAQASNQVHEGHFNSFREQVGEILPTNLERNFSGFLVRKEAISFKVDPVKVSARIALLKDQLLIAKFVGPKPTFQDMEKWLQALNQQIGESVLTFCMNVGKGYFFLKGEDSDALSRALMMSPHKSK